MSNSHRISKEMYELCQRIQTNIIRATGEDISFVDATKVVAKGYPIPHINVVMKRRKKKGWVESIFPVEVK